VIEEAPNNNPLHAWHLIRAKSGLSGWLCGIHKGDVKFKSIRKRPIISCPTRERAGHPYHHEFPGRTQKKFHVSSLDILVLSQAFSSEMPLTRLTIGREAVGRLSLVP
jgi:hypothetical protein